MPVSRYRPLVALISLVGLTLGLSAVGHAAPRDHRERIIVALEGAADPHATAREMAARHDGEVGFVYDHVLHGFSIEVPADAVRGISRDRRVRYVEHDQLAHAYAQEVPTGVRRVFADDNGQIDIDGADDHRVDVDVAVIDTGIDLDHPDLHVVSATDCSGGSPLIGSCGAGGDDDNGHGTHVAGTIGAVDDGAGVVGVAPGARLHAVKVLRSDGSGYISWIVAGIDHVTANADTIEVANMSLGCECSSAALDAAIADSVDVGVAYAVAAGNSSKDVATFSPANHPDVLTVSALADFDGEPGGGAAATCRDDEDDTFADFSNHGSGVEVIAPGVCIRSTWHDGGYHTISGTSMASPHAAGALALLASGANDPTDQPDVEQLYATVETSGNLDWDDGDDPDSHKEALVDVGDATVYDPALVAGSGDGGSDGDGGGSDGGETTEGIHVGDLDGASANDGPTWTATVAVTVHAPDGAPLTDATVALSYVSAPGGVSGTATCTTGADGACTVSAGGFAKRDGSVTFTVDDVVHVDHPYTPSANHDPDGDSGGTSITVAKP